MDQTQKQQYKQKIEDRTLKLALEAVRRGMTITVTKKKKTGNWGIDALKEAVARQ
jgi:hypothetical protein